MELAEVLKNRPNSLVQSLIDAKMTKMSMGTDTNKTDVDHDDGCPGGVAANKDDNEDELAERLLQSLSETLRGEVGPKEESKEEQ